MQVSLSTAWLGVFGILHRVTCNPLLQAHTI